MKTSIALLVLLIGVGLEAPAMATASARPSNQEHTYGVLVRYGDLNVNTAKGAEQLYRRISYAAHEACSDVVAPSYALLGAAYRRCRQTAVEDAVAKVDRPRLTALYGQHFPENPLLNDKPHGAHAVG